VALSSYGSQESSTTFKTLEDFAQKEKKRLEERKKLTWLLYETLKLIMFSMLVGAGNLEDYNHN
jgi:hypothetical protein